MTETYPRGDRELDLVDEAPAHPRPAKRLRRTQYISLACSECRRRKVKCSGGNPCRSCSQASSTCQYTEGASRGPAPRKNTIRLPEPPPDATHVSSNVGEQDLLKRILRLESEVKDIRGCSQSKSRSDNHSALTPSKNSEATSRDDDESDEGIHEAWHGHSRFASLAAQIQSLKNLVLQQTLTNSESSSNIDDCTSTKKSNSESHGSSVKPSLRCIFPTSSNLNRLINLFFTDFDVYFPTISYRDFCSKLYDLLPPTSPEGNYQGGQVVEVDSKESLITAALMFMILAVADFLDAQATHGSPPDRSYCDPPVKSHVQWHRESRRMINLLMPHETVQLDVLRWHLLEALYLLIVEKLRLSSHAILTAVDLAFALELNDESTWAFYSFEEKTQRRVLWWTLYLFDRRIAHRTGRGYLIHDEEVSVSDFSTELSSIHHRSGSTANSSPPDIIHDPLNLSEDLSDRLYDEAWYLHLQFHVKWSQLFSKAWDQLFALRAPKAGDVEEIEKLEALVLKLKREIPPDMVWDEGSWSSIKAANEDRRTRLQLIMFTRINILRLLIRHNLLFLASRSNDRSSWSPSDLKYTAEVCQKLAPTTIEAITSYMRSRRSARSFGTFATLTLVECLYHVLLPESTYFRISSPEAKAELNNCVEQAKICLQDMATTKLKIASNALQVLGNVFASGDPSLWHSIEPPRRLGHRRDLQNPVATNEHGSLRVSALLSPQRTVDQRVHTTSNNFGVGNEAAMMREDIFELSQNVNLSIPPNEFYCEDMDLSPWGIDVYN